MIDTREIAAVIARKKEELRSLQERAKSLESDIQALEKAEKIINAEIMATPPQKTFTTFSAFIDEWLRRNKISQIGLCDLMHVSHSSIANWKAGKTVPSMKCKARMVNALSELDSTYKVSDLMTMMNSFFPVSGGGTDKEVQS